MKKVVSLLLVFVMVVGCCTIAYAACAPKRSVTCTCATGGVNQQYAEGAVNGGGIAAGHEALPHIKITISYKVKSTNKTTTKNTGWLLKKSASLDVPWGTGTGISAETEGKYECVDCNTTSKMGNAKDTW